MTYTDDNRGSIQNRERRRQIIDFSNLRFKNITPTDCDGLIEYHGKAYVFFEIKYRDAPVPRGQLLALVRCVDDLHQAGKRALLIIAEHDVDNPNQDINAANCAVRIWYDGKWKRSAETLKELTERFVAHVEGGHHE